MEAAFAGEGHVHPGNGTRITRASRAAADSGQWLSSWIQCQHAGDLCLVPVPAGGGQGSGGVPQADSGLLLEGQGPQPAGTSGVARVSSPFVSGFWLCGLPLCTSPEGRVCYKGQSISVCNLLSTSTERVFLGV